MAAGTSAASYAVVEVDALVDAQPVAYTHAIGLPFAHARAYADLLQLNNDLLQPNKKLRDRVLFRVLNFAGEAATQATAVTLPHNGAVWYIPPVTHLERVQFEQDSLSEAAVAWEAIAAKLTREHRPKSEVAQRKKDFAKTIVIIQAAAAVYEDALAEADAMAADTDDAALRYERNRRGRHVDPTPCWPTPTPPPEEVAEAQEEEEEEEEEDDDDEEEEEEEEEESLHLNLSSAIEEAED
jgi:Mg-chelatase subunit ChlI